MQEKDFLEFLKGFIEAQILEIQRREAMLDNLKKIDEKSYWSGIRRPVQPSVKVIKEKPLEEIPEWIIEEEFPG